jgi:hypothetical protein
MIWDEHEYMISCGCDGVCYTTALNLGDSYSHFPSPILSTGEVVIETDST